MQGEDQNTHSQLTDTLKLPQLGEFLKKPLAIREEQLLSAWCHLYINDQPTEQPWVFVTAGEDAAASIIDFYDTIYANNSLSLGTISLPVFEDRSDDAYLAMREKLKLELGKSGTNIGGLLKEAAYEEAINSDSLAHIKQAYEKETAIWEETVSQFEELSFTNRSGKITFQILPDIKPRVLFHKYIRSKEQNNGSKVKSPVNTIIATFTQ